MVEVLKKVASQTSNALPSFLECSKNISKHLPFCLEKLLFGSFQKGMLGEMFFACGSLVIYFRWGGLPRNPSTKTYISSPKDPFQAGPSEDPPASVVGTALRQAGLDITAENVLRALKAVKPGEEPSSKDLKADGIHRFFFAVHLTKMCLKLKNGS